jgi:hypothetical protein
MSAELPVAVLAVTGNGTVVGFMHFQPDRPAFAGSRPILGGLKEQRGNTASAHVRRDSDRVEAGQPRPSPKEHDRRSGKTPVLLGNKHLRRRRVEEVTEAATREPIGGKHPMLKLHQRIHVAGLGAPDADAAARFMIESPRHSILKPDIGLGAGEHKPDDKF